MWPLAALSAYYLYKHKQLIKDNKYISMEGALNHYFDKGLKQKLATAPSIPQESTTLLYAQLSLPCRAFIDGRVLIGTWFTGAPGREKVMCSVAVDKKTVKHISAFDVLAGKESSIYAVRDLKKKPKDHTWSLPPSAKMVH